jgi:uncharacterized membrane protein
MSADEYAKSKVWVRSSVGALVATKCTYVFSCMTCNACSSAADWWSLFMRFFVVASFEF